MKFWYQFTVDARRQPAFINALQKHAAAVCSPGTEVSFHGMDPNLGQGLPQSDLIRSHAVYSSIVVPLFLRNLLQAQRSGCDAFIIGTFAEPALKELRSLADIPVLSVFEASMQVACTLAPRVGLLALSDETVPYLNASIARHGVSQRVSGIHRVDATMPETALDQEFAQPGAYLDRVRSAVRVAIAEGADAVIPGEGIVAAIVAVNRLSQVDDVPLIDAVGTALLSAEHAVRIKQRLGLTTSRRNAYVKPSAEALARMQATWSSWNG